MRILVLILLPWLAIFLQSTIFSFLSIKGTTPDLVLVFVTFFALFNTAEKGSGYAFFCGLLEDLYMGRFIGLNALSKGLTAYIVGRVQGNVFKENLFVGVFAVLIATALNYLFLFLISIVVFDVFHIDTGMLHHILYQAVYNTIVAIPLYIWYFYSSNRGVLRTSGRVK
ncbi:MAG TPA: rod shape-determining protein MreD [Gelria sp.]|nr:rod shape-determining protein MreD [Gelria sp.]